MDIDDPKVFIAISDIVTHKHNLLWDRAEAMSPLIAKVALKGIETPGDEETARFALSLVMAELAHRRIVKRQQDMKDKIKEDDLDPSEN